MLLLEAQLTHADVNRCLRQLQQALPAQPDTVVVDAGELVKFDSSVLAVLLACRREALRLNKNLVVKNLPVKLRELAGLYGVEELLPALS